MNDEIKKDSLPVEQVEALPVVSQENAVLNMLNTAIEKGIDADSLEKVLNMQERILDRQAEQAYTAAMVDLQTKIRTIGKNKINTQTSSKYADLGEILKAVKPLYTEAGFVMSFGEDESPKPDHVRVTCDVMHRQGHREPFYLDIPLDDKGIKGSVNKTKVHATGSAVSYGRRYLMAMILNLNTGDDDDGNKAGEPPLDTISEHQVANLDALIQEVGADKPEFLKFMQVEALPDIYTANYNYAVKALESKRG